MKQTAILLLSIVCVLAFAGCGLGSHTETDYAAAIMAEGRIYLKSAGAMPAEVDESAIIGYTTSYTDTFPEKDGETNFNRELNMPYARVKDGIAVLYEHEWYLCTPMDGEAGSGAEPAPVFHESPPSLTVRHDGQSVAALKGTYSWQYTNPDGTSTGIEADSMHPLDAKEYMPVLPAVKGAATLVFDTAPDEITVRAWPVSQWGNLDAADDAATVTMSGDEITLLEDGHIYEVVAKWTRFEEFGGTAYYSFCTSPLGVTLTAENVTATGLTLVCTQSGGAPTGDLQTGSPFWLETWADGYWEGTPRDSVELVWTAEAWTIPENKSVQWPVSWESIYYPLPVGRYRIGKEIMDFRGPGDYDTYRYYAEFEVK